MSVPSVRSGDIALEVDTQSRDPSSDLAPALWAVSWLLRSTAVGVQVSRRCNLLAEQGQHRVGVLPARVFGSVRNAFAHLYACESAALDPTGDEEAWRGIHHIV